MAAVTVFFNNGEVFVISGDLSPLQTFYDDLIAGDRAFVELSESTGVRVAIRRKDVSSAVLDPGVLPNTPIFSPLVRMQTEYSSHVLNEAKTKAIANAQSYPPPPK